MKSSTLVRINRYRYNIFINESILQISPNAVKFIKRRYQNCLAKERLVGYFIKL
jgi:hypothetical protein